jgi:Protein of unknown function (DUF2934)
MAKSEAAPAKTSNHIYADHYPSAEEISARAHQIFVERGREPGHDKDDWLKAERELTKS